MKSKHAVFLGAAILSATLGASAVLSQPADTPSAPAGEKVCLQSNRMMNYDIVDERTLRITDRFFRNYTVRMASGCVGLTKASMSVVLQAHTSLGCLGQGDRVAFVSPGLGRLSCFIIGVENYVPPQAKN